MAKNTQKDNINQIEEFAKLVPLTKIVPRKRRRLKSTRSIRADLNKRLGAHDRWMRMATDPMFTKSIGRWEKLRNELRSRETNMGEVGGLYLQDRLEEQGFARRVFKMTKEIP